MITIASLQTVNIEIDSRLLICHGFAKPAQARHRRETRSGQNEHDESNSQWNPKSKFRKEINFLFLSVPSSHLRQREVKRVM